MTRAKQNSKSAAKKTILLHSADRDMVKSLSILLQSEYKIVTTESVEELTRHRIDRHISLLMIDLERTIPALLAEFECRRQEGLSAPIIVLYAYRQGQPELEKQIRSLTNQILYKPVPIDQVLSAIAAETKVHGLSDELSRPQLL